MKGRSHAVDADATPGAPTSAPPPVSPKASLVIRGGVAAGQYPIEVACGGDCSGYAVFSGGAAELAVEGAPGCTLALGHHRATITAASPPLRFRVDVSDQIDDALLPDVLDSPVALDGTFECPGAEAPSRAVHVTFGAGALRTAVWGYYRFTRDGAPPSGPTPSGATGAITVLNEDQLMAGPTLEDRLVRFIGPPSKGSANVRAVGQVEEIPRRVEECTSSGGPFLVRRSDWSVSIYGFGSNRLMGRTTVPAGPLDCAQTVALPIVHLEDGSEVRLVRPDAAALDAAMTRWLAKHRG